MRQPQHGAATLRQAFRLGAWLVEPELARITRDGEEVRLRPRAMDVLVHLAMAAGAMASRRQLIDAVWQTEFVSDHALTQVVAELRAALGDEIWIGRSVARFRFLVEGEPTMIEKTVS